MKITRCGRVQNQILLLLAGELSPGEAATVRDHLRECSRCTTAARELAAVQKRVEAVLPLSLSAPPTLDARVLANIRRLPARQPMPRGLAMPQNRRRQLVAVGAVLVILGSGYFIGRQIFAPAPTLVPIQQVATLPLTSLRDDYAGWLRGAQSLSVPGSDARQVSARMIQMHDGGRCIVAPVTFQAGGAQMIGGCWHQVNGTGIAFMAYQWQGQRVALYQSRVAELALPLSAQRFVFDEGGEHRCYQVTQDGGVSYVAWQTGETHYILVAQAPPERLLTLARSAQGSL